MVVCMSQKQFCPVVCVSVSVCVRTHVKARGQHWPPINVSTLIFETKSFTKPGAPQLVKVASQQTTLVSISPTLRWQAHTATHSLYVGTGDRTQVLRPKEQAHHGRAHLQLCFSDTKEPSSPFTFCVCALRHLVWATSRVGVLLGLALSQNTTKHSYPRLYRKPPANRLLRIHSASVGTGLLPGILLLWECLNEHSWLPGWSTGAGFVLGLRESHSSPGYARNSHCSSGWHRELPTSMCWGVRCEPHTAAMSILWVYT